MKQSPGPGVAAAPFAWIGSVHALWWLTIGAIALRMLLFLGRGDYVAFDEGWYLLLGRNLMAGDGFTLTGLRHIALSPLFPILAGVTDRVIDSPVWAGRIVAAITGGLLVVPCWYIFRRIAGRRTALIACLLIAVMPSLAPFVVPYWIGWDLWVGAEPLLHLFVYTGLALSLRALDRSRTIDWAVSGLMFGVAYLARPEAVITFGFLTLALAAVLVLKQNALRAVSLLVFVLGFAAAAAPYWVYLHDITGRWTITGRDVAVLPRMPVARDEVERGAARPVEHMLWRDDDEYAHRLYALDAAGERLADGYWGVPGNAPATSPPVSAAGRQPVPPATSAPLRPPAEPTGEMPAGTAARSPNVGGLLVRALGVIVPLYLWPLVLLGVLTPRRSKWRQEVMAALPLAGTAVVVAIVIAVDPRTQLLIVPLVAFYAARGVRLLGAYLEKRLRRQGSIRQGFVTAGVALVVAAALFGTDIRRLYMSLTAGSPHHLVGTANRQVGEALRRTVPADQPVMSWHPAIALYARRDWRVLPYASFDRVVRYANAVESEYLVLSAYYPTPLSLEQLPREYLVLRIPPASAVTPQWGLQLAPDQGPYVYGELQPREP